MSEAPLLRLTGITKQFGAVQALRGVSFELQAGEVHALLGENGAGKSTLIKIITGAHQPDSGEIKLLGRKLVHLSPRAAHQLGIACIYQQPALFKDLDVAENMAHRLEAPRLFKRLNRSAWRNRAAEILEKIGAEIAPDALVSSLSMPQQQLVEIACALGLGVKILILDEPTASLTQREQHLLYKVIRELRSGGVGIIYISHRLEEIMTLADRVTVLRDGASVGMVTTENTSENALIRLMVGREVLVEAPAKSDSTGLVLEARQICFKAAGIENLNLQLHAGQVTGLAGLVGAGRTELARILFGITPADAGEILCEGKSIIVREPADAIAAGIAYLPEDRHRHAVILEMSVAANISLASLRELFPARWLRAERETAAARTQVDQLRIRPGDPGLPAGALSGGNQQKAALARWLTRSPRILILDEPTQGIDVGAKAEIHRLIRALAKKGAAILMISSDLPEILSMSDRILVMRDRRIAGELPAGADAQEVMRMALGLVSA